MFLLLPGVGSNYPRRGYQNNATNADLLWQKSDPPVTFLPRPRKHYRLTLEAVTHHNLNNCLLLAFFQHLRLHPRL